ncbi:hypothetical protein V6U90_08395 [Micromonospora sp. CPCC 206060]|uniref:hypothetical protein n=1 Tax=Micromonospora sp. CPCC 206060 TaxID=3122406 RepID=UPI002FF1B244
MTEQSSTRTGRLMHDVRRTPTFRQLLPMESMLAWPIPLRRGAADGPAGVYLRLPVFGGARVAGGGVDIHPPFATLTVCWGTGRIVEYTDLRFTRPWPVPAGAPPVGRFPGEALRVSIGEYLRLRERLLRRYDELLDNMSRGRSLPTATAQEFGSLLARLIEPGLEPYLRILGPKFFDRFLGPAPGGR